MIAYKKSKKLKRPKTIQGDNQFDNKKIRDFCNGYVYGKLNIRLRGMTNKSVNLLFEVDKELQTKKGTNI